MAQDGNLPFDRGATFKDGFTASAAVPHVALQIAGNAYQTIDDSEDGHGTGQVIELMPVVNRAGASITLTRTGVRISTLNSHTVGDSVNGVGAAAHGTFSAWLPDDRYASGTVITDGDVFHVVKRGPALARLSTRGGNIAVNDQLCWTTGAKLRAVRTFSNPAVVARAMQAATTELVQKMVQVIQQ